MANIKNITLTGTETEVKLSGTNCDIRNDSEDIVYASANAGVAAGADGVLPVPAGGSAKLLDCSGTVYLLGTGAVVLCGNDYSTSVFNSAAASGGVGGAKLIVGTEVATLENCPEGAWYGQYSVV